MTRSRYIDDEAEGLGTSAAAFAVSAPGESLGGPQSPLTIQRTDQWSVRCEYIEPKAGSIVEESETREP